MIHITEKENCTGCAACTQSCPVSCIAMTADEQGFLYPKVDQTACVECHLCEKVCPVINAGEPAEPLVTLAAKSRDADVRARSASGGVFNALAQRTIAAGGAVYGARFNADYTVEHGKAVNMEEVTALMGSKYVQSSIGDCFKDAEKELTSGRKVLFTGTPCQIAGLKHYLRKDYDNLLAVELICHSVPSPKVWQAFLRNEVAKGGEVAAFSFRDKRDGWNRYAFSARNSDGDYIYFEPGATNTYMRGFLADLFTRPSCSRCPAKSGRSGADITIGDFWGVKHMHPDIYDEKGVPLVLARSPKGADALRELPLDSEQATWEEALASNPALVKSRPASPQRAEFWRRFGREGFSAVAPLLGKEEKTPLLRRIARRLKRMVLKPLSSK